MITTTKWSKVVGLSENNKVWYGRDEVKHRFDIQRFSSCIKAKRGDLSLRDVATSSNVSISTLSRLERGYEPDLSTLMAICDWLQMSVSCFLKCEDEGDQNATPTKLETNVADEVSLLLRSASAEFDPNVAVALSTIIAALHNGPVKED